MPDGGHVIVVGLSPIGFRVVEELLEPNWSGLETVHSLTFAQKMR